MGKRSGAKSTTMMNANAYENIRKNNIKEEISFNSISESIQKTLNQPNSAFIYSKYVVDNQAENECKVNKNNFHITLYFLECIWFFTFS